MTQREKLKLARHHLSELGLPRNTWQPPLWRLLWRLGVDTPPPLFWGFGSLTVLFGSFFGAGWGALMWVFAWSDGAVSVAAAIIGACVAGLLFGLCMATYFRHFARKHDLPSWTVYTPPPPRT